MHYTKANINNAQLSHRVVNISYYVINKMYTHIVLGNEVSKVIVVANKIETF